MIGCAHVIYSIYLSTFSNILDEVETRQHPSFCSAAAATAHSVCIVVISFQTVCASGHDVVNQ